MKETVTIYTCESCGREFEDWNVALWHTALEGHAPRPVERELSADEYKTWQQARSKGL